VGACGTPEATTYITPGAGTFIDNELDGVACPASTHCVAVGRAHRYSPYTFQTLIEDSTGGAWATVSSPSSSSGLGSSLNDVACPTANLCIAVGQNDDAASTPTTLIEQNSGHGWVVVPSPNPTSFGAPYGVLSGVACISVSDCIAVGTYDANDASSLPLIEEYRGNGWIVVPSPQIGDAALDDVACTADARCVAVGDAQKYTGDVIIERSPDGAWQRVPGFPTFAPPCASGATLCVRIRGLDTVACSRGGACFAAGIGDYRQLTGGTWSAIGTDSASEPLPSLLTCGADQCVGATSVRDDDIVIEEETAGAWSTVATLAGPSPGWQHSVLPKDLACAGTVHCVVVGSISQNQGAKRTLIADGVGSQWAFVSSPNAAGNLASPAVSS
jgi:hypothetical protein